MERYSMFLDRKNQYCENDYATKCNQQIPCDPYQITNGNFHKTRTKNFIIHIYIYKVTQLCPTLCYPMDYTVHGILQARKLEWEAIPFFRGSSQPRDRSQVSCIAGRFFTSWATISRLKWASGVSPSPPRNITSSKLFATPALFWDPPGFDRIEFLKKQNSRNRISINKIKTDVLITNWTGISPTMAQRLKRLPPMQDTWVWSLGREDPLEKEMAMHSHILAWRIPWTEEPGRLQSTGSQRVGHNWTTSPSPSPYSQ